MKKLMIVALCATSLVPVTPAFAITPEVQAELQQTCVDALTPNDPNSEFQTEPTGVSEVVGAEFEQSSVVISSTPAGVLLSQTSALNANSEHRHGGSPNIFGTFTVTSTYTGGTSDTLVTYAQTTTTTFGCHVWKVVGNEAHPNIVEPAGLQIPGGSHPDLLSIEDTVVTRSEHVIVNNPDVIVNTTGDGVICNSPTKNPGTWRAQNGYTGECSTALFNTLPGVEPISSNSQPAV